MIIIIFFLLFISFPIHAGEDFYFIKSVGIKNSVSINFQFKSKELYYNQISPDDVSLHISAEATKATKTIYENPYITIFVDHSNSMRPHSKKVVEFYHKLLNLLDKNAIIKLITFNRLAKKTPFDKPEYLPRDISYLKFRDSTKLWDTLYYEIKNQENILRPKYFILLSDGWDQIFVNSITQYSKHTSYEVLKLLKQNNTKIFGVSFGKKPNIKELAYVCFKSNGYYFKQATPKELYKKLEECLNVFFRIDINDPFYDFTRSPTREISIEFTHNYKYKNWITSEITLNANRLFRLKHPQNRKLFLNIVRIDTTLPKKIVMYVQAFDNKKMLKSLKNTHISVFIKSAIDYNFENKPLKIRYLTLVDTSGSLKKQKKLIASKIKEILESKKIERIDLKWFGLNEKFPFYKDISSFIPDRLNFNGPTPLYDAIYSIMIKAYNDHENRRRILIFTDGWDEYFEGTHKRYSKKRAIDIINTGAFLKTKIFVIPFGESINKRTLNLICEGTNGKFLFDKNISSLFIPDLYEYALRFANPFYNGFRKAIAEIKIKHLKFDFLYKGEKWKILPVQ